MRVEQMRAELTKVYTGPDWIKKVSVMSDAQIIAIYYRLLGKGRLK